MFKFEKKEIMTLRSWWLQKCTFEDGSGFFLVAPNPEKAGKIRKTSPVCSCIGSVAITESGSHYKLGLPSDSYINQLGAIGKEFDPMNPIPVEFLWKAFKNKDSE
jgi:hypothetical protein